MPMSRQCSLLALCVCAALSFTVASPAKAEPAFADHAAIDTAVQAFTGAPVGAIGGARAGVDRRLRLAPCSGDLVLGFHGNRVDMLTVACPDPGSWRIFVALNTATGTAPRQARAEQSIDIVARGDMVSIIVEGPGFSVQQSGEAMEAGAQGEWIRVRPSGTRDTLRAHIEQPGRVVISRN